MQTCQLANTCKHSCLGSRTVWYKLIYWPGWVDQTCCNNKNNYVTNSQKFALAKQWNISYEDLLQLFSLISTAMSTVTVFGPTHLVQNSTWPVSFFDGYFVGQAPGVTLLSTFCLYTQYFLILFVTVIHFLHMSHIVFLYTFRSSF